MTKVLMVLFLMVFTLLLLGQNFEFVGVDKCKTCHRKADGGEQFPIWEKSKHAGAFETLKSEAAAKIAKEKGLSVPAYEAPECIECHTTGFGKGGYEVKDEAFWNPADDDKDGASAVKRMTGLQAVGCESCHGAGSAYRKKKVMQSREESIKNGMNDILVSNGSAVKQCKTCHNEKSPTYKKFNFEEKWKEIAHPIPAGTEG
jgi:hypothetical protein